MFLAALLPLPLACVHPLPFSLLLSCMAHLFSTSVDNQRHASVLGNMSHIYQSLHQIAWCLL